MKRFSDYTIELFEVQLDGEVSQVISSHKNGRVKFQGSYWPAKIYQPKSHIILFPGQSVTIIGRKGITLLILIIP